MTDKKAKVIQIPTFDFEDLHGKNLKIYASKSRDGMTVIGIDEETSVMYVLHQEINIEPPKAINNPWWY